MDQKKKTSKQLWRNSCWQRAPTSDWRLISHGDALAWEGKILKTFDNFAATPMCKGLVEASDNSRHGS